MKIEITPDSPILLKIIPEISEETYQNVSMAMSLKRMGIYFRVMPKNYGLVFNIDPIWEDFTNHYSDEEFIDP